MAITIEQMPDWAMLRRQKQVLVDLCAGQAVTAEQEELLTGLTHFLDHFQDTAATTLGEDRVFCEYEPLVRQDAP
jgi:hypothetical protein